MTCNLITKYIAPISLHTLLLNSCPVYDWRSKTTLKVSFSLLTPLPSPFSLLPFRFNTSYSFIHKFIHSHTHLSFSVSYVFQMKNFKGKKILICRDILKSRLYIIQLIHNRNYNVKKKKKEKFLLDFKVFLS